MLEVEFVAVLSSNSFIFLRKVGSKASNEREDGRGGVKTVDKAW